MNGPQSVPETAIKLSSVGIKFNLNLDGAGGADGATTLKKDGIRAIRSLLLGRKKREFWALKDISLEIHRGEIFGVIGGNGAGKSTLLKIIAGIFPATEGTLEVQGKIAPLIELGAAFNPELTGAENIFLTGSIYKVPRRVIREKFDDIVDFSGLPKFIHSPLKNYSTGMFLRLAFSTVIFFQPDIVLIDEVFSVGDEVFQRKSFEKIISFKERGATILLVSHDLNLISQIAGRAIVLSRGHNAFLGPTAEAVDHYHQLIASGEGLGAEVPAGATASEAADPGVLAPDHIPAFDSRRWGNREVEITSVRFVDERGNPQFAFAPGDYFEARISYISRLKGAVPVFGVAINTIYKMLLYGPNTLEKDLKGDFGRKGVVRFIIPSLPLFEGDYLFSAASYDPALRTAYDHHEMMYHFKVIGGGAGEFGCVRIDSRWELES